MCPTSLEDHGWTDTFARHFADLSSQGAPGELAPGRVILHRRDALTLATETGETDAVVAGRLLHKATGPSDLPTAGDWVAYRPGTPPVRVEAVLPRRSRITRKAAGRRSDEQVVAANVDVALIVMGLDGDYNPRRLERFLVLAWDSGATPVVLLNKADLLSPEESEERLTEIEAQAMGVPVHLVSAAAGQGLETLAPHLHGPEGPRTAALLGSSGVGKSTIINRLVGRELLATRAVREGDDRGQHTTTHRQLVRLPGGGLLIDNPGIREVGLWSDGEGLTGAFRDIDELAQRCRFGDCGHQGEPGCTVEAAVEAGELDSERLESFHGLQRELRYLELRRDESARAVERKKWRVIHKAARKHRPRSMG